MNIPLPANNTRIGFHYYPDTIHYRESDLDTWLPQLKSLGARWLVLVAPADRSIPESFITGLVQAGIEPVLHLQIPLGSQVDYEMWGTLFSSYASWGAHYIVLFDRPNCQKSWSTRKWLQEDLVEQFIDAYMPLAEIALACGLTPVFPPLQPGGDYWDTSFLRGALQSLKRHQKTKLLENFTLAAYAWTWDKTLNWGAGGPERWPGTYPYSTPAGEEDELGFRAYEWYLTLVRAELTKNCPVILLGAGHKGDVPEFQSAAVDPQPHKATNELIARLLLTGEAVELADLDTTLEAIPTDIIAGNFWILSAAAEDPNRKFAWFQPDGSALPIVQSLAALVKDGQPATKTPLGPSAPHPTQKQLSDKPIAHYLLLPSYEWGISDWHLNVIQPFVKKYQPTTGFSINEAALAEKVTLIGGEQAFSEETVEHLRSFGCKVERISGDGTTIATILSER